MSNISIEAKDATIMKLVHYFITEQDYVPIIVQGVHDEVWLENDEAPYKIVRINSNYIHNAEQYRFDIFKTKNIMRQIKKKTLSLSMNVLNIHINLNEGVDILKSKNIDAIKIDKVDDVDNNKLLREAFPNISDKIIKKDDGLDLIIHITGDINRKTEENNQKLERTFKPKPVILTKLLILINVIIFLFSCFYDYEGILTNFAVYGNAIRAGEYYRIITGPFLHGNIFHLLFNMYALYIIGSQVETYLGRTKFLLIYLVSAITGSLMSMIFTSNLSVGASGAIFGLLGCLLYFGYHHRLYLGSVLRNQIIPVILINLAFGFLVSGIDNAAHIGGLVGGFFSTMALGIANKDQFKDRLNGWIVTILYLAFLIYAAFFLIG